MRELGAWLGFGVVAASDPSLRVLNVECNNVRAVASRLLVDPNQLDPELDPVWV